MTGPANGSNSITKTPIIDRMLLKQDHYFESLLQGAYQAGAITDDDINRIQIDCINLLADKSKKYTSGSESVLIEEAEMIMRSNLYTVGLYLKSFPTPYDAVTAVKSTPVSELYILGQRRLKTTLAATWHLYHSVIKNMVCVDYSYYFSTLTNTIRQFFAQYTDYHMWYKAHELPDGMFFSYPLCNNLAEGFIGIEYVQKYLRAIYYENKFCKVFTDETILQILLDYSPRYNDLVFNIFEKVLCAAVEGAAPNNKTLDGIVNNLMAVTGIESRPTVEYIKEAIGNVIRSVQM